MTKLCFIHMSAVAAPQSPRRPAFHPVARAGHSLALFQRSGDTAQEVKTPTRCGRARLLVPRDSDPTTTPQKAALQERTATGPRDSLDLYHKLRPVLLKLRNTANYQDVPLPLRHQLDSIGNVVTEPCTMSFDGD